MKYNVNRLSGVDARACQNPRDAFVTGSIRENSMFDRAMDLLSRHGIERILLSGLKASSLRLTPQIAPQIFEMVDEACEIFGVQVRPEIFMERRYSMDIAMIGSCEPVLIFSSALLAKADEKMLWGLIAAHIAAIRTGYCELRTINWMLDQPVDFIPELAELALKKSFLEWRKCAQLSFDRYALLACGDFNAVMRGILIGRSGCDFFKDTDFTAPDCGYMRQCREFARSEGMAMGALKKVVAFMEDEIYAATRALELEKFWKGDYAAMVARFRGQEVFPG